jgi:hypothetical protein
MSTPTPAHPDQSAPSAHDGLTMGDVADLATAQVGGPDARAAALRYAASLPESERAAIQARLYSGELPVVTAALNELERRRVVSAKSAMAVLMNRVRQGDEVAIAELAAMDADQIRSMQ